LDTKNLPLLKIHKLSNAQYERELIAGRIDENALYLTPEESSLTEEKDPTVPAWAKEATKPTYTADEVGALSKDTLLFSGNYEDLTNAPDISEDDSGDLVIADKDGNIIFRSNGSGFETVNLIVQNITINGKTIQEMIQEYVNEAILGGAW
jgi:hypothetical protein